MVADEEVERLVAEINKERQLILALPVTSPDERKLWAERKRTLGGMIMKHQVMIEQNRLAAALAGFEEEHGAIHREDCPLCLESVPPAFADLVQKFRYVVTHHVRCLTIINMKTPDCYVDFILMVKVALSSRTFLRVTKMNG